MIAMFCGANVLHCLCMVSSFPQLENTKGRLRFFKFGVFVNKKRKSVYSPFQNMKQVIAICCLLVLCWASIGHRVANAYAQWQSDVALENRLDAGNFSEQELFTIKVPISLPYQVDWQQYQRVDGEIEIDGVVYHYVQQKITNDTMFLQCIPHTAKNNIAAASVKVFESLNDLQSQKQSGKKIASFKGFTEFEEQDIWKVDRFIKQTPTYEECFTIHYKTPFLYGEIKPPIAG